MFLAPDNYSVQESSPCLSELSDNSSRPSIHWVSWLSRSRHCPPTLKAGRSFRRIILCSVRVETCRSSAASGKVRSLNRSSLLSIGCSHGSVSNADAIFLKAVITWFYWITSHETDARKYRIGQVTTAQRADKKAPVCLREQASRQVTGFRIAKQAERLTCRVEKVEDFVKPAYG